MGCVPLREERTRVWGRAWFNRGSLPAHAHDIIACALELALLKPGTCMADQIRNVYNTQAECTQHFLRVDTI